MEYINVESSSIIKVAYDENKKELFVVFTRGAEYKYLNVDKQTFELLISAKSVGKFFNQNIFRIYDFVPIEKEG